MRITYYIKRQYLSSFFIKQVSGLKRKYVRISGIMAIIKGNIKFIYNSCIVKYLNITQTSFVLL